MKKKTFIYILLFFHLFSISPAFAIAPFSPDLIYHYDAQDMNADGDIMTGEPSHGTSIAVWQDIVSAFSGSQIIASHRPLYQTGAINGSLPGISFDGTDDILKIDDVAEINLDETFNEKSFALVIETGTDITSLQTIYEQGTHYKGYGFQIFGGNLYGGVWNILDWSSGNEYKIIDYGPISINESYYITLVHDNTSVRGYLDGILVSTLSSADVQTIHGICQFDTFFACSLYGTGGTIGIGATQNDTTNLATQSDIQIYQGNYFSGSIGELISWNRSLSTAEVGDVNDYLVNRWNPDSIAPTIDSYSPNDNVLFPTGIFSLEFTYSDNIGGSGINTASGNITLQKWDSGGGLYAADISGTYITTSSITTGTGSFDYSGVPYGKYKTIFEISDIAGNAVSQEIVFYIDAPEIIVSTGTLDLGNIDYSSTYFSNELEITVKTVGAAHDVFLKYNTDMTYLTETIPQFTTLGYGYDLGPAYSNTITNFGSSIVIGSQGGSINTNGNKNTYTYRVKIGALIDIQQAAGDYEGLIDIGLELNY